MKTRRLTSLLLCAVMLLGSLSMLSPLSAVAEDATAPKYNTVKFDELLTFDEQTTGATVSTTNLATMVKDSSLFNLTLQNSAGTYAIPEGDDNNALYLSSDKTKGISINDPTQVLKYNNFVFSYDFKSETLGKNFNTVRFAYTLKSATKESTLGLMPVGTGNGGHTYCGVNESNVRSYIYNSGQQLVTAGQWYHYDYYVDVENKLITAFRDGVGIWNVPIPDDFYSEDWTNSRLYITNGSSGNAFYFDNIRVASYGNDNTINTKLDFESLELSGDKDIEPISVNRELSDGIRFVYAEPTYTKIAGDANNKYISAVSKSKAFTKFGNFFIQDPEKRLANNSWVLTFDFMATTLPNGTHNFLMLKPDRIVSAKGESISLMGLYSDDDKNGITALSVLGGKNKEISASTWYKFAVKYNATAKKLLVYMLDDATNTWTSLGSTTKDLSGLANTILKFGYNWNGLVYDYSFDNLALRTYNADEIFYDFEEGEAGQVFDPAAAYIANENSIAGFQKSSSSMSSLKVNNITYETDESGNTYIYSKNKAGQLTFTDSSLRTLTENFVFSFDVMPKSTFSESDYYISNWYLDSKATTANRLWVIQANSNKVTASTTALGNSYNFGKAKVLTPNEWTRLEMLVEYDKELITFFVNGEVVVTTSLSDCDLSQYAYSAFRVLATSDSGMCFDNVRIYFVEDEIFDKVEENLEKLPESGDMFNSDFEKLSAGELAASGLDEFSIFGSSANGSIVEAGGSKQFNGQLSVNISNKLEQPYENGVISINGSFTFGDNNANGGNIVIASLNRKNNDGTVVTAPLLTASADGTLTLATEKLSYKLPKDQKVNIKLELSYAFHTVNLYVDGVTVATAIPLMVNTQLTPVEITAGSFTDDRGITYSLPFSGYYFAFAYDVDGNKILAADGAPAYTVKRYENYGYAGVQTTVEDSIVMMKPSSENDAWTLSVDDLRVYFDEKADVYRNTFDGWSATTATTNKSSIQNVHARYGNTAIANDGENAYAWTNGTRGSLAIDDKLNFLSGKNFVLEVDLYLNPDMEGTILNTPFTALTNRTGYSNFIKLHKNGDYGIDSDTASASMRVNKWEHFQLLFISKGVGSGHKAYIYNNGQLIGSLDTSHNFLLRIGNENGNYTYDFRWDNVRIYLADTPETTEPDFDDTLNGNKLISFDASNADSRNELMGGKKTGVTWNFKSFSTTLTDINGATVNVLLDMGDFLRVNRNQINSAAAFNVAIQKGALMGYEQYVIETELRYTCPTGFDLEVARIFDAQSNTYDKLLYIPGTSREICFNHAGITYSLTDKNGNLLYVENVTEDATKFTKLALIVDEVAGTYSVYVNGNVAYYKYGDEIVSATEIEIDALPASSSQTPAFLCSNITVNNMPTSVSANALLDIKSINVYALRNGVAPKVVATQSKTHEIYAQKFDVRFIAPIDSLYGSEVGFEVSAKTAEFPGGTEVKSSNTVYSSILAVTDAETKVEEVVEAEYFNGTYIAIVRVTAADKLAGNIEFTVKPFVIIGDSKIYNEEFTIIYNDGKVVTE